MTIKKIFLFSLLVGLSIVVAACANAGFGTDSFFNTVTGTVTENGEPVTGTIEFINTESNQITESDIVDGNYTVTNLSNGNYSVKVNSTLLVDVNLVLFVGKVWYEENIEI